MGATSTERIVVVKENPAGGWEPMQRFADAQAARQWLAREAQAALYHILAFRDEDVVVAPAPPQPTRNVVAVGKQHLERGPREAKGEAEVAPA